MSKLYVCITSAILIIFAPTLNAESKWNGSLELGYERDSSVVIDDIDVVVSEANSSRRLRFKLGYSHKWDTDTRVRINATLVNKNYMSAEQFDRKNRLLSTSINQRISGVNIGSRFAYGDSSLNEHDFIEFHQASPYVSFFTGKQFFHHISYRYADKVILTNPDLSSIRHTLNLDSHYFINGINHYIQLNGRFAKDEAREPIFSYEMRQFKLAWIKRFKLGDTRWVVRTHWRYQFRDYDTEEDFVLSDFRKDKRQQLQLALRGHVFDNWYVDFAFRHNNNQSNLELADYRQKHWQLGLGYEF